MAEPTTPTTPPRPCPICGKPAKVEFQPFCTARCADIDLNRWLSGAYVIPVEPVEDEEEDSVIKRDDDGDED